MKKMLSLLLFAALLFTLAACGQRAATPEPGESQAQSSPEASPAEEPSEPTAEPEEEPEAPETPTEEPAAETGGTLIAYFSWSGNTEEMAAMIQAETGGDLFEIAPATPYTDDYDALLDIAQQDRRKTPALPWLHKWKTGKATMWSSWATPIGGAMRRWSFTASWNPTTGPVRR